MFTPTRFRSFVLAGLPGGLLATLLVIPAVFAQSRIQEFRGFVKQAKADYDKGDWTSAARNYDAAFKLVSDQDFKSNRPLEATLRNNRACTYHQLNRYPKAEEDHNLAIKLREKEGHGSREEIGESYCNRGCLYLDWAKYDQAIKDFNRSLHYGGDKGDRARPLCQLGRIHLLFGEVAKARDKLDEALEVRRQAQGDTTEIEQVLGQLAAQEGDYAEAERLFLACLRRRMNRQEDRLLVARTRNELGLLYYQRGKYAHAREELQAALREFTAANLDRAQCLLNLANLAVRLGRRDEAKQAYEESERVLKAPSIHPAYASCLSSLGQFWEEHGELERAAQYAEASVRIIQKFPGHPDEARHLANLGWVYHALKDTHPAKEQLALRCYQASLPIWQAKLPNDPMRARVTANAGWLQHNLKNYQAAETCYQEALRIRAARGDHRVALSHANLAGLYASKQDWPAARREMMAALQGLRAYEQKELLFLPDADQLLFLANERSTESHISILHMALSLALASQLQVGAAEQSAEWVLNSKGIAQETLAQFELLLRDAGTPFQHHRTALQNARAELARLALLPDSEAQKDVHQRKAREHTKAEESLIAQLTDRLKGDMAGTSWVELAAVRQSLPHDAVLIEFARYRRWDFGGTERDPWREPRYAAWIIPPQGQGAVRLADLGPAAELDAAARQLQAAMAKIPEEARSGRFGSREKSEEEELLRGALSTLAKGLLTRLEPLPAGTKQLMVSADGDLWLVPFAALATKKGFLVDDYTVSYLVSGRDLLYKAPGVRTQAPLVLADAAFGGQGTPFGPLPGTAREARAIKKHMPVIGILSGNQASEARYRELASPEMLFLCTHGFCIKDLGQAKGLRPNPFNQFGLAFADANTALIGEKPARSDGIMLGKEVLAADLRGTRLVVLSACKTALGEKRSSGEGMASLRQAFHLAGARDVVATLWEVPDQQSAQLIDLFVENLCSNPPLPPAQALCRAQRDYLAVQRALGQAGHTHPFFWAAYGLSGPNRN